MAVEVVTELSEGPRFMAWRSRQLWRRAPVGLRQRGRCSCRRPLPWGVKDPLQAVARQFGRYHAVTNRAKLHVPQHNRNASEVGRGNCIGGNRGIFVIHAMRREKRDVPTDRWQSRLLGLARTNAEMPRPSRPGRPRRFPTASPRCQRCHWNDAHGRPRCRQLVSSGSRVGRL